MPNRLGVSTNLSATATFGSTTTGALSPISAITTYGPAGMSLDVRGAGVCTIGVERLEALGPSACPTDSRVGLGRAAGLAEFSATLVPEPLTLEFFLAPKVHGHLTMLIYANATAPVLEQFAMTATEVHSPKPYGLGISLDVPSIATLPGAAPGWVERVLVTLGSANVAYFRTVHGKRTLEHVKGVMVPKHCAAGGFPLKAVVAFADGSTTTAKTAIPCPSR